jgi:hypothetical protein
MVSASEGEGDEVFITGEEGRHGGHTITPVRLPPPR